MPTKLSVKEASKRFKSWTFFVLVLIVGLLAILAGFLMEEKSPAFARIFIVIGSSAFGTCIGLALGGVTGVSTVQRIRDVIERSLSIPISATDEQLKPFREYWHHYLATEMDGRTVWRYRTLDFAGVVVPGKLAGEIEVPGRDGQTHTYPVDGYLARPRLIIVQTASAGDEPPVVHVYPRATEQFRERYAGIAVLQSWDGNDLMAPVLMCLRKLDLGITYSESGTLPDAVNEKLNAEWGRSAASVGLRIAGETETGIRVAYPTVASREMDPTPGAKAL